MKTAIIILALIALSSALPKGNKSLRFRNLYREPSVSLKNKPTARIIGGSEATPHSLPYQVLLELYDNFQGWYCGGSLISNNYIITAGHCGDGALEGTVTLGAHKPLQNEDTQVRVDLGEVIVHDDYDEGRLINDIAIIRLSQPVDFTDAIQPIALPSRSDANNDFAGTIARLSGWGLTDGSGTTISDVLNYVDLEVISYEECRQTWWNLQPTSICTSGKDSTGPCGGDSGGPLAADGVLIGVVSFGSADCYVSYASGYARVTSFLDWIENNTDVQLS